jgi:hypothetical protein
MVFKIKKILNDRQLYRAKFTVGMAFLLFVIQMMAAVASGEEG